MGNWLWPILEELRQTFRIADAFDIALISLLLYAILVWFKTTASRSVAVGVSVLTALYFVASVFDLYLTSLVFQGAFAVLLVVLVVVFQEDLRRMLERLASWGSLSKLRASVEARPEIDSLVEAAFHLAESRTGALIVLRGREPLDRHIDGGIRLQGVMSKPLLYSIFDASSPGHDGAVVLVQDRIVAFGAHLPISKNQDEIRGRGTRHSAGLGLSELSDALVIVVSEERGVVSIAQGGVLRECNSAGVLKEGIDDFYQIHFPKAAANPTRQFLLTHWPLKMVAFALAVFAWFTFAYQPSTIQRTFVAPVEYRNVKAGLIADEQALTEVRITLSGLERGFRFFDPASLRVAVDMSNFTAGRSQIIITDKEVRIPTNLKIYRIEPRTLAVTLRKQLPRQVIPPITPTAEPPMQPSGEGNVKSLE